MLAFRESRGDSRSPAVFVRISPPSKGDARPSTHKMSIMALRSLPAAPDASKGVEFAAQPSGISILTSDGI